MFRPYVQDDWRVSKNLTVNLGLAWALTTPDNEAHNRMADFNPANAQFLIAGQNAGNSAGILMDKTALEPRIGVAWKPFSSDKTVVRGGYCDISRLFVEPGRPGLVAEPALLCGIGLLWLWRRVHLRNRGLRYDAMD